MTTPDELRLDPAVVARLYLEHAEELRRFLLGILRDVQLANDALQSVFTTLAEKGHQSREESRRAWLFQVAYNQAMLLRRRESVGDRAIRQVAWSRSGITGPADEPLLRLEAVENVRLAISKLSADQQQILSMRIYDEKTFAEIAQELQIPLGTALGRMRLALEKLRKFLSENRDFHEP